MLRKIESPIMALIAVCMLSIVSCREDDPAKIALPVVATLDVVNELTGGVTVSGTVTEDGNTLVTSKGFCWGMSADPTLEDSHIQVGGGEGAFEYTLLNLDGNATYHVRAYATNKAGTSYGSDIEFVTSTGLPTLSTVVSGIGFSFAEAGGDVTNDGGLAIQQRGICYSETIDPTINDAKVVASTSGTGEFDVQITHLKPNRTYHIRAFAENTEGVGYGPDVEFVTPNTVQDASETEYPLVSIGTQIWLGKNLKTLKYNNGEEIGAGISVYDDEESNANVYGRLYSWNVAMNVNGVCPTGMHVPTLEDWQRLFDEAGGLSTAGSILKEAGTDHWLGGSSTDEFEFTALPGGIRVDGLGFDSKGGSGFFWSATEANAVATFFLFGATDAVLQNDNGDKQNEMSIRCIAD